MYKKLLPLALGYALLFCSCDQPMPPAYESASDVSQNSETSSAAMSSTIDTSQESSESQEEFSAIVDRYRQRGLVTDDAYASALDNTSLLVEWVECYRQGFSNTLAVLLDGIGFPSALYVFESDGSDTYSITEYRETRVNEPVEPLVYQSSMIVERAYDYVFGADIPADVRSHAIVIHHTAQPTPEAMEWKPETDAPFYGLTPVEAEQRAEEVENLIYRHMSVISNIYGGGIYLKENVLSQVAADYEGVQCHYKTVGAIRLNEHICYLVYGNGDAEALARGEHGGSVTAVSTDGALVFIQSMVDGQWIFADDANQATYPGTWPEVENFYQKAAAMGYTDEQLAILQYAPWASANTVLNLTDKSDHNFSGLLNTGGRYMLGSYLVDAGGEAMTACMYLQDRQTGQVTILPDWQNGYSSFGFLNEESFYAAIARVGGADYEAGVRFYSAASPKAPFARWDLTDSSAESDMEKMLLTAYHSAEDKLLAAFWCEIPTQWGGWVKGEGCTYQVTLLDYTGTVIKSLDTKIALTQGNRGISPPNVEKPMDSLPPLDGVIYFEVAETVYALNLESGTVDAQK